MEGWVRTPEGGGYSWVPREASEPTKPLSIPQLPIPVNKRDRKVPSCGHSLKSGKLRLA